METPPCFSTPWNNTAPIPAYTSILLVPGKMSSPAKHAVAPHVTYSPCALHDRLLPCQVLCAASVCLESKSHLLHAASQHNCFSGDSLVPSGLVKTLTWETIFKLQFHSKSQANLAVPPDSYFAECFWLTHLLLTHLCATSPVTCL